MEFTSLAHVVILGLMTDDYLGRDRIRGPLSVRTLRFWLHPFAVVALSTKGASRDDVDNLFLLFDISDALDR